MDYENQRISFDFPRNFGPLLHISRKLPTDFNENFRADSHYNNTTTQVQLIPRLRMKPLVWYSTGRSANYCVFYPLTMRATPERLRDISCIPSNWEPLALPKQYFCLPDDLPVAQPTVWQHLTHLPSLLNTLPTISSMQRSIFSWSDETKPQLGIIKAQQYRIGKTSPTAKQRSITFSTFSEGYI